MKKKNYQSLYLMIFVLLLTSCASVSVTNLKNVHKINEQSLIYALPQTIVKVEVTAINTKIKRGIFAPYAEKYLGLKDVNIENNEIWEISDIKLSTEAEPDPQHYYLLEANGKTSAKFLNLSKDGLIMGLNNPQLYEEQENNLHINLREEKDNFLSYADISVTKNAEEKEEIVMKKVRKDTSFVKVPIQKKQIKMKTLEEQAQEAAGMITKSRKRRFKLQAAKYDKLPEGKALEVMVEGLTKTEHDFLSLFTGIKTEKKETFTFYYIPNLGDTGHFELFSFSKNNGIITNPDKNGAPITIKVKNQTIDNFLLDKTSKIDKKTNGFAYRFPQKAEVEIWDGEQLLILQKLLIAQYGSVLTLPSNILDSQTKVEFYQKLGMIKSIKK